MRASTRNVHLVWELRTERRLCDDVPSELPFGIRLAARTRVAAHTQKMFGEEDPRTMSWDPGSEEHFRVDGLLCELDLNDRKPASLTMSDGA